MSVLPGVRMLLVVRHPVRDRRSWKDQGREQEQRGRKSAEQASGVHDV